MTTNEAREVLEGYLNRYKQKEDADGIHIEALSLAICALGRLDEGRLLNIVEDAIVRAENYHCINLENRVVYTIRDKVSHALITAYNEGRLFK